MRIKIVNITYFLYLIIVLSLISCNKNDEVIVNNPELVFSNSLKINVDPYTYEDNNSLTTIVKVLGDLAFVADTVSSLPELQWEKVGKTLITAAISKEEFQLSANKIINVDQIIWQWQSGMEFGEDGKVAYLEGKTVKNKNILYDTQPLPLKSGLYYWAVWSWENSGREVLYSSKPQKIYIK